MQLQKESERFCDDILNLGTKSVDLTALMTSYASYSSPVWTLTTAGGTSVATPTAVTPSVTTTYVLVAENASGCKDTANVVVTVNALPITPFVVSPVSNTCPLTSVNLTTISNALTSSVAGGVFEWYVSNSSSSSLVSNQNTVGAGDYYLFEKSPANCYSLGQKVTISLQICCPPKICVPVTVVRTN